MKKKLQVFVSSTYTDLRDERTAVVEAILRAGHIPAGMELFAAGDESQMETIRRWIDESDVFMLILGGRYGTVEKKTGKSYIELEFDYAIEKGKPYFTAVISDTFLDAKVKAHGAKALETDNAAMYKTFADSVKTRIVRFFNDLNELKVVVFESINGLAGREGLSGWVRGSDVVDPKAILEQVNRLQSENDALRQKVAQFEAAASSVDSLSEDAMHMIEMAADSREIPLRGRIHHQFTFGQWTISAGDHVIHNGVDNREAARWKSAVDVLCGHKLLEPVVGSNPTSYRLTYKGYQANDEIKKRKSSGS